MLAQNLYFEVGGSFTAGNNADWFGTIFAPNNKIFFGSNADIASALYSGDQVKAGDNLDMKFVLADNTPFLPTTSVPEPTTIVLLGLGFMRRDRLTDRTGDEEAASGGPAAPPF